MCNPSTQRQVDTRDGTGLEDDLAPEQSSQFFTTVQMIYLGLGQFGTETICVRRSTSESGSSLHSHQILGTSGKF